MEHEAMSNETEKTHDSIKKNRKKIIAAALGIVLIALLAVGGYMLLNQNKTGPEALQQKLETIGADFYENFYYDNVVAGMSQEDIDDFFSRFTENGIKVNLDNLSRYNSAEHEEEVKSFVNHETNVACDINNTRAVIYPKAPYGKTDYDIQGELDCGYEDVKAEE